MSVELPHVPSIVLKTFYALIHLIFRAALLLWPFCSEETEPQRGWGRRLTSQPVLLELKFEPRQLASDLLADIIDDTPKP